MDITDVTAITVNFRTETLLRHSVECFRKHYPDMLHFVVDNNSRDESTEYIRKLGKEVNTIAILNEENFGQGEALNQAILKVETPLVFILCSDCTIQRGGLVEKMVEEFNRKPNLFAIGNRVLAHKTSDLLYIHLFATVLSVEKFLKLASFDKYPKLPIALETMIDAQRKGYLLEHFPVWDYVDHVMAGTWRDLARQIKTGEVSLEEVAEWPLFLRNSAKLKNTIAARRKELESK